MAHLDREELNKKSSGETATSPAKAIEQLSHDLGAKIGTAAGEMTERANEYVGQTRSYVKEHPLQSLAIAVATGAALGSFISLVSRRRH